MRRVSALLLGAALALAAWAGPRDGPVAAVVVEVKGVALLKEPDSPPSRRGTQIKLLQPIHDQRTVVVDPQGKLVLSFASSSKRVTLTGPVTALIKGGTAELTAGAKANLTVTTPKGREAVLAPKDRMDFSRMGGVSARALGNVRTDQSRPALSLAIVREEGSRFSVAPGETKDVVYLLLTDPDSTAPLAEQAWTRGTVHGVAGDRVALDWDLAPGTACFVQLDNQAPQWIPEERRYGRTDYWLYRYPNNILTELKEGAQVADQPGSDRTWRQLQLASLYRTYHLYDRAIERVAKLPPQTQTANLLQELKAEQLESERSVGG